MKTYDKQKLNEYAKELFALCLEKGVDITYDSDGSIHVGVDTETEYLHYNTNMCEEFYKYSYEKRHMPIWELIEKVKAL